MVFLIGKNAYTLAYEHKNGWNAEVFRERYSEILERYDYIVGDWGYNQLRLRGFYREGHPRVPKDFIITSLMDYIQEYCNFGCAYFVLAKIDAASVPPGTPDLMSGTGQQPGSLEDESGKQTAETAAASASHNGILMRWPIKERSGGPAWMPGAAAVARAVAEAEKRQQQTQHPYRASESAASGNNRAHQPNGRSAARHSAGQAEQRGRQKHRGSRSAHAERHQQAENRSGGGWRSSQEPERYPYAKEGNPSAARIDDGKSGGRWNGKPRHRTRFGGKPHRYDGAHREPGGTTKPDAE